MDLKEAYEVIKKECDFISSKCESIYSSDIARQMNLID